MKLVRMSVMAVLVATWASVAMADPVVLDTGKVRMGINDAGGLGGAGVGFVGPTGDAINPGCLCEGWGAAANGSGAYTYGNSGDFGIVSSMTTFTDTSGADLSAKNVAMLVNGLQVTHTYSYAANGDLFRVNVQVLNTTGATLTDVRYARTLDWDVTPGYFNSNNTTIYGGTPTGIGGKVIHSSTDPFAVPDPMVFRSQDKDINVVDKRGDLGSYFVFGFGDLLANNAISFDTYIGANRTVAGLLSSFGSVGVEAYSYTTGDEGNPAYGYGFVGLGLPPSLPLPEPATLGLMGIALASLMATRRRA